MFLFDLFKRKRKLKRNSKKFLPLSIDDTADKIAFSKTAKTIKVNGFSSSFKIKKSKDNRYVFMLYAPDRTVVATSQIYASSVDAINGINSVILNAEKANLEDQTLKHYLPESFPKWEIYIDNCGKFRFRLSLIKENYICHSQGFTQKSACKKGIDSIIKTVKAAQLSNEYFDNNDDTTA